MGEEPNPFQYEGSPYYGSNYRPADGVGRFFVWQGTFKEAIEESIAGKAGAPFVNVAVRGSTEWQRSNNQIKLIEEPKLDSGAITFKLAPSWSCMFQLETSNSDFFEDELRVGDDNYVPNDLRPQQDTFPNVNVSPDDGAFKNANSFALIGLMEDDYFSCDVDAEFSNIAQLRVRIDGVDYFDNTKPNENVWVRMIYMRRWDANYVWPEGQTGTTNPVPEPDNPYSDSTQNTQEVNDEIADFVNSGGTGELDLPESSGIVCPTGFVDNGYGICVKIENDGEIDPIQEEEFDIDSIDVSTFAIFITIGLVGYILKLALGGVN
tara:strand:- start:5952 stop:6914 length:963 start_codon:yes stop_codon:yes gene_type:complete